jgi:hypothetical protein
MAVLSSNEVSTARFWLAVRAGCAVRDHLYHDSLVGGRGGSPALQARLCPYSQDLGPSAVRVWRAGTIHAIVPVGLGGFGRAGGRDTDAGVPSQCGSKGEGSPCASSLQ